MKLKKMFNYKMIKQIKFMRIIGALVLLLFVEMGGVFASPTYSEQTYLSINAENKTIKEVFNEIEKNSEYIIFFLDNTIDTSKRVNLSVKNKTVNQILDQVFKNTSLTYSIDDRQVVISRKNDATVTPQQQKKSNLITGLITEADGNPVVGATIVVKGTTDGVLSDVDGRYSIKAKEGDVLEFRFIGYNTDTKTVKKETNINVRLVEASMSLDDVVVIGYGQQKKESVVASINSIGPSELVIKQRNLKNGIAGQIAGVIAVQRSGEPGNDGAAFYIRGESSYAGGTSPLVLVDGVPRSMDDIDVDEIESFTVLKDAAATAVYGAEGANGVVLITSKRGKAQKTSVSVSAQYSIVTPTRMPGIMDSYDYMSLYNEAYWNDKGNPFKEHFVPEVTPEALEMYRTGADTDLYPNANWMDLLNNQTQSQRYTINFRGGSDRTQFFVSGAYYQEDGIFKSNPIEQYDANIGLQRFNLRSNVDMTLTKTTKLAVDMSGQYLRKNTSGYGSDAIFGMISHFPTHLIPMYYSDGTASDHLSPDASLRNNPYNMLNNSGYIKSWQAFIQSKVTLSQQLDFITSGLSAKASISFDANFTSATKRSKTAHTFFATGRDEDGKLIKRSLNDGSALSDPSNSASSGTKKIYLEASLNYKRVFAEKHDVSGMLLYMQKETQSQKDDGLKMLPYRKQSVVARATYGFDDRYMAEASFGATGSENFAEGNRWGIFPAVGAAWFISHENFMQGVEDFISKLKIRTSYGLTGNDNIINGTRFAYRESLSTGASGYYLGLIPGANGGWTNEYKGISEGTFPMPGLTWEIEKKYNLGLDLGLFRGQVDLSVDYFSNRRSEILLQRKTISSVAGFVQSPYQNFGITTNKGFEGTLILKHKVGEVDLSARGNFTYAKNKIIEFDEIPQKYSWQAQTGRRINQPNLYLADGLYTPDDFYITTDPTTGANAYKLKDNLPQPASNVSPGDIKYKDLNEDNVIDGYDKSYNNGMYSSIPEIVYGFGVNAEWKGFFVGVFFQGVANTSANLLANVSNFTPFYNGRDNSSGRTEVFDRWKAEDPYNQDVLFPRVHTTRFLPNFENSTWWYRDAGFLRLKNVEIGYDFNKNLIQQIGMKNLRLYIQGSNIALWDKVKYWDPELGGAASGAKYPICGTYTVGLEVTF